MNGNNPHRSPGTHKLPRIFRNGISIHQPRSLAQSNKKIAWFLLIMLIAVMIWAIIPENDDSPEQADEDTPVSQLV